MNNEKNSETLVEYLFELNKRNIPVELRKREVDRFLEMKARVKGIPLSGFFELTPHCNLDCKMCYVHSEDSQSISIVSLERWKLIIDQAHSKGMMYASLSGGECLAYPHFKELYLHLINHGIEVVIYTNGVLLEGKFLELFQRYKPRKIQVTLYGSSEDAYESVTGHKVFRRVYQNILNAKEAGLTISISITPNRFMWGDEKNLLRAAKNTGLKYHINSGLMTPREYTGREKEDLSLDQYIELYKYRAFLEGVSLKNTGIENSEGLEAIPDFNCSNKERKGIYCGAGRSSFSMRWDGYIYPCVSISDLSESILVQDFETAWNKLFVGANNYSVPIECAECELNRLCQVCVAMHNEAHEKGHCNKEICHRTKRLIAEGFLKK